MSSTRIPLPCRPDAYIYIEYMRLATVYAGRVHFNHIHSPIIRPA